MNTDRFYPCQSVKSVVSIKLNAGMDLAQRPQSTQRQRLTTLLWITVRVSHLGYLKLFQPFFFACLAPLREIFITVFSISLPNNEQVFDDNLALTKARSTRRATQRNFSVSPCLREKISKSSWFRLCWVRIKQKFASARAPTPTREGACAPRSCRPTRMALS